MKKIFLLSAAFLSYSISFCQLQNGLVGHFTLNGNADDISTINIDGTATGTTTTTGAFGQPNTALEFSATSQSMVEAGISDRSVTNQVSICAWIKTTGTTNQHIVGKYNWSVDGAGYYLEVYQNKAILAGRDGSGPFIYPGLGLTTVNDGQWHYIVGVVNGNTWELWVDCVLEQTLTTTTTSPDLTSSYPLSIGYYHEGSLTGDPRHFDGTLDEVRVYNRALTSSEIQILCQQTDPNSITEVNSAEMNAFLSPNPTDGKFVVNYNNPEPVKIQVYSSTGQLILESSSRELDLTEQSSGIYFVLAMDLNGIILWNRKLIKNK
jgi:hypothetical protein